MRDGIIYDCPSVNCKTPIYTGKCRKDCLKKRNKELGINPQTNADRIRAMSDEELADILTAAAGGSFVTETVRRLCYEKYLDFLKQPVKDGEGGGDNR